MRRWSRNRAFASAGQLRRLTAIALLIRVTCVFFATGRGEEWLVIICRHRGLVEFRSVSDLHMCLLCFKADERVDRHAHSVGSCMR